MSTPKAIAGSERAPLKGATEIGPANPNEKLDVTIRLRSRAGKKPIVSADAFTKPDREPHHFEPQRIRTNPRCRS